MAAVAHAVDDRGSFLALVEGATVGADPVLTEERIAHIEEMLAMEGMDDEEAEQGGEEEEGNSGGSSGDENEYGFISRVLGPGDLADVELAPGPMPVLPSAKEFAASETKANTKVEAGAKAVPVPVMSSVVDSFPRGAPAAKNTVVDSYPAHGGAAVRGGPASAGPPKEAVPAVPSLSDAVLERPARRRRAARRPRAAPVNNVPQPAIWNVIAAEMDATAAAETEKRRALEESPLEPIPPNEEEVPVEPEPVISKFMQLRARSR